MALSMSAQEVAMDVGDWAAVAAFALNAVVTTAAVTWKLSRVELALSAQITKERKEIDEHIEQMSREFGETVHAMRQKIHEMEVWNRDNFVRRDGFYIVKDELTSAIRSVEALIAVRLEGLEAKIAADKK